MTRKINKMLKAAMFAGLSMMSGATVFQGCGGSLGGYDYGDIYSNPYFPAYEQSVNDYQQATYDYTNSLWDDYIRE